MKDLKSKMRAHWENESCGMRYGTSEDRGAYLSEVEMARYRMEPHIPTFAEFENYRGRKVLEVGIGAGVDFTQWVRHGALAVGIDIAQQALRDTRERLKLLWPGETNYALVCADAESLCFRNGQFDLIYSYGCLHHTLDPSHALKEAFRILKPGGELKGMFYRLPSWTGYLLWTLHSLLRGRPWQSPKEAIFENLESPGTQAFRTEEVEEMLRNAGFISIRCSPRLSPGDLLLIRRSERYQRMIFELAQRLYPRWLVKRLGDRFGFFLLVKAQKPKEGDF